MPVYPGSNVINIHLLIDKRSGNFKTMIDIIRISNPKYRHTYLKSRKGPKKIHRARLISFESRIFFIILRSCNL